MTERREALTVLLTAILADEGERVQVVRNGVVETRPVRGGLIRQGRREVLEGLKPGEQVVARAGALPMATAARGAGEFLRPWSIRRPVPAIAALLVLLMIGLYSFSRLAVTAMPNIDLPLVSVSVAQPGAAPSNWCGR